MVGDTIMYVVWGILLLGILIWFFLAYRSRQLRTKRLLLMDLFNDYFRGDVSADQLGQRTRQIADRHFIGSAAFYSVAVASFQNAVDTRTRPSTAFRGATEEIAEIIGSFEERVRTDGSLSDRRMAGGARMIGRCHLWRNRRLPQIFGQNADAQQENP